MLALKALYGYVFIQMAVFKFASHARRIHHP